jgi:hypothetical protein
VLASSLRTTPRTLFGLEPASTANASGRLRRNSDGRRFGAAQDFVHPVQETRLVEFLRILWLLSSRLSTMACAGGLT